MKVYLIRHGRQNSRRCNVNVELAAEGRRQAELLAKRLKNYPITALYSSDLIRAEETARIISREIGLENTVVKNLHEISFGVMTGLPDPYIAEHFQEFHAEQQKMDSDLPYPGGECGRDVWNRAEPVIRGLAENAAGDIAIVVHGGIIRTMVSGIFNQSFDKKWLVCKTLENCSITELDYDRAHQRFSVERVNDYAHLEAAPELLRSGWKGAQEEESQ